MARRKMHLHDGRAGAALTVRVTPRSSRTGITGILDDGTVKIRIAAAPVDGEANHKLIEFLAETLHVPKTDIDIVGGAGGRDKLISVVGMDAPTLHARILAALP